MVAGLLAAIPSLACAPVPGEGKFVRTASEEAIIVWDEGAKRQHFIRRASFDTDAKDFGFLVPTPSKPELGESDDRAFEYLAELTAPAVVRVDPPADGGPMAKAAAAAAPAAVTVLEVARVAGLDAAVLEATDAAALDGWLKQHGYPSSPALVEWYAPYIGAKWKITAFKIAAGSSMVSSAAVRMSFQAERPFFPYREPATQRGSAGEPRLLRVYLIAEGRMAGSLPRQQWPAQAVWSNQISNAQLARLLSTAKLPAMAGGGARWLTEFEDRASPRPGTDDVYFERATYNEPLARPPRIEYGWSFAGRVIAAAFLALIMAALGFWAWRRARRKNG